MLRSKQSQIRSHQDLGVTETEPRKRFVPQSHPRTGATSTTRLLSSHCLTSCCTAGTIGYASQRRGSWNLISCREDPTACVCGEVSTSASAKKVGIQLGPERIRLYCMGKNTAFRFTSTLHSFRLQIDPALYIVAVAVLIHTLDVLMHSRLTFYVACGT